MAQQEPRRNPRRHRRKLKENIQGITKPVIKRLARKAGAKCISGLIYEEARGIMKYWLEHIIKDAVIYCDHSRRKTLQASDVVMALKKANQKVYGYTA